MCAEDPWDRLHGGYLQRDWLGRGASALHMRHPKADSKRYTGTQELGVSSYRQRSSPSLLAAGSFHSCSPLASTTEQKSLPAALPSPQVRVSPVYHLAVGGLWRFNIWAARLKENPPYPADGVPVSEHLVTIDPDFTRVRGRGVACLLLPTISGQLALRAL